VALLEDFQQQDEQGIYAVSVRERLAHPRVRAFVDHLANHFRHPSWKGSPDDPAGKA
jgi:DNA-binding transcriptional LysR family regulator